MPITTAPPIPFAYRLLISPRYRPARYAMLITTIAIIALNVTLFSFRDNIPLVGNRLYGVSTLLFLSYLAAICLNLFVLVPNFLLKKKYGTYIILLSVAILFMIGIQILLEYLSYTQWNLPNNRSSYCNWVTLLDVISSFATDIICLAGSSMPVVFKHWVAENQRFGEIEKKHLQNEVNNLKEQVSPYLLLNTLHTAGILTIQDSTRASDLLMQLSRLLRYQLYDCNWNYVSLHSEIHFLTNFLRLEQLCNERMHYSLNTGGNIAMTVVPPLLFIPFIRYIIEDTKATQIDIQCQVMDDTLDFSCQYLPTETAHHPDFKQIRQRLNLLYQEHFQLSTETPGFIQLHLNQTAYGN